MICSSHLVTRRAVVGGGASEDRKGEREGERARDRGRRRRGNDLAVEGVGRSYGTVDDVRRRTRRRIGQEGQGKEDK